MSALLRLLGLEPSGHSEEQEREQMRKDQYERIKHGLHEAAQRVHYLEIEEELRSRKFKRRERESR